MLKWAQTVTQNYRRYIIKALKLQYANFLVNNKVLLFIELSINPNQILNGKTNKLKTPQWLNRDRWPAFRSTSAI